MCTPLLRQSRLLPIARLADLQRDIEAFAAKEHLNGFQQYIVTGMYRFGLPDVDFLVRSILITASPVPAWADVEFAHGGRVYRLKCLAPYVSAGECGEGPARAYGVPAEHAASGEYHFEPAPGLPMKRLAARSGLAVYGRNNICYIEGMGSFFTLDAWYTDMPCAGDGWADVRLADGCAGCKACVNNCPTGAIRQDRFLIDNERCLSYFNEGPGEFPGWIPPSAHHLVYDCLKCQLVCPMNSAYGNNTIGPIAFDDGETRLLLAGGPFHGFTPALQGKTAMLGMDKWLAAIPRNLRLLFDMQDRADPADAAE